jgi:hypothetical protein
MVNKPGGSEPPRAPRTPRIEYGVHHGSKRPSALPFDHADGILSGSGRMRLRLEERQTEDEFRRISSVMLRLLLRKKKGATTDKRR